MTRNRDVSAVQNNLGVAIPPAAAGKNAVINGGMDIWQRGTSVAVTSTSTTVYTADRWQTYSASANMTVSRQATGDTTNLPNIQYCARIQRTASNTATGAVFHSQSFETVNSIPFAGKTVTFSFYARAGANFSASSNQISASVYYGTGTDQNLIGGYTGSTTPIQQTPTLTTTWQRFTYTGTIASTATEIAVFFGYSPTGTAGAADYFEITGVQLELGSSATPFSRAGGTIQGELAACQRYYYRNTATTANAFMSNTGNASSTTVVELPYILPVTMRTGPTSLDTSTLTLTDNVNTIVCNGTFALLSTTYNPNVCYVKYTHGSAVFTQYRPYLYQANSSANAYIGFSAEL